MQERPISFHRALWEEVFFNEDRAVCASMCFSNNGVPRNVADASIWEVMATAAAKSPNKRSKKETFKVLEDPVGAEMMQTNANLLRRGILNATAHVGPPTHGRKITSKMYDCVDDPDWQKFMGLKGKAPAWRAPGAHAAGADTLTERQKQIVQNWHMFDHTRGDSMEEGVRDVKDRLDRQSKSYAPFGSDLPMMLADACLLEWPRALFSHLFLDDNVLAQGKEAVRKAADARLRETFDGVYEPKIKMTLQTCFSEEMFDGTPEAHRGRAVRVLSAGLIGAADMIITASFHGKTLTAMFGSSAEIEAEHIRREQFFAEHWDAFRKMWVAFYIRRAATTMSTGGDGQGSDAGGDDSSTDSDDAESAGLHMPNML